MIFIVVKFNVLPECAEEWVKGVSDFTSAVREEPGNLWFEWSRGLENPNQFVLVEAFRDGRAGAEHVNSEHFKSAIARMPLMLAETPEIINVEVPGTTWSEMAEMSVPGRGLGA